MTPARRNFAGIIISLAGLGLLAFLFHRLGPDNILYLFRQIAWRFFVIVAIYGTEELVRAAALIQCIPHESRPVFRRIVYIRLIGEAVRAVTLTGPLLSEATRAWFIRKQGVRGSEAVAAAIGEYAANSFVAAFLTIAGVIYLVNCLEPPDELRLAGYILMFASAGFLMAALIIIRRRVYLPEVIYRPGTLRRLMALECVAHALLFVETFWALISMGLVISFLTASLAEILTKLANVAFVGVTEGAYVFLFHALGLPVAAGFALALVKRLRSFALALIGIGSFALMSIASAERH